jgi:isoamylase
MSTRVVTSGASAPLGATVRPGGVNFSVVSKHATLIEPALEGSSGTIPQGQ